MSRENLKLAVVAGALSSDPRSAAPLARKLSFGGLQFDVRTSAFDVSELSTTGQREFLRVLSAQDQQLVGFRHDLGSRGFGKGADIDHELSRLRKVTETIAPMGSPLVCVDIGPLPEPIAPVHVKPKIDSELAGFILLPPGAGHDTQPPSRPAPPPPDPALVSQVDAAMVELGRMADRTRTVLAFRAELASLAAIERALRAADCPWFGLDLDPAAIIADELELDDVFSRLGPLIRHVRGRDALGGFGGRTRPAIIGQGATNWSHLLSNLDDADYNGWITIDPFELPDRPRAAAQAAEYLRTLP